MGVEARRNPLAGKFGGSAAAPPQVRDAVGRVLEVGDEILVVMPSCLMRVASVKPILHPGAPPNLLELVLVTRMAMAVPRDTGVENLYRLRHESEIGDGLTPTPEPVEAPDGELPVGDESGLAEKATRVVLE